MFGISYRMLGSVADAEDVVQDTWLRWNQITQSEVSDPRGYLVRAVTHTAIDHLRRAKARREQYVGSWLPEPLVTEPDVAEAALRDDSVSVAILVMLESLSPLERAVYVLREAFAMSYPEVAQAVGRSESAVRQLGHRAKAHVQQRRPRFQSSPAEGRAVTERFLAACLGGDLGELLAVLAPDVTLVVDARGKSEGANEPLHGARLIAEYLAKISVRYPDGAGPSYVDLNGAPGGLVTADGQVYASVMLDMADSPEGVRIETIWVMRTPEKLAHLRAG